MRFAVLLAQGHSAAAPGDAAAIPPALHVRNLSSARRAEEPVARKDDIFEPGATLGRVKPTRPCVSHCSVVASRVPLMVGTTFQVNGRVEGRKGLLQYLQWRSGRAHKVLFVTCVLTGNELLLGSMVADRRDFPVEVRDRLVHFEELDRLYPAASVPRTPLECLEFEQRCWWMRVSLKQGCYVHAVSRMQGLL